jgi:hypothetical protein
MPCSLTGGKQVNDIVPNYLVDKAEAKFLVRCQGCLQFISSLSPIVNELIRGILSWAKNIYYCPTKCIVISFTAHA